MQDITVFVVDDEEDLRALMLEALEDDYNVSGFQSGDAVIAALQNGLPDIILLDVNMAGISGYETCQKIRAMALLAQPHIMFISGHNSLEDRLKAYSAGGDDFVPKPVPFAELLTKIEIAVKLLQVKTHLSEKEKTSSHMAFQAMTEASQYGAILQCIKDSFTCNSLHQIADSIFGACTSFSLKCCVQIRGDTTISLRRGGDMCSPMENELFELIKRKGRIYSFNQRAMFNADRVSVLIANMPPDNPEQNGRILDLIATIVETTDAAVLSLCQRNALSNSLQDVQKTIASVKGDYQHQEQASRSILDKMLIDMDSAIQVLGLTDEQERYFISLAETAKEDLLKMQTMGKRADSQLESIAHNLTAHIKSDQ